MITRTHIKGDAPSEAVYSDCERYRYLLTREWDAKARRVMFIMLNPSKATEVQNDPTIERCERRARALGYGAMRIANIFAWRETSPRALKAASAPVGPENDALIGQSVDWADDVIAAWGAHGEHMGRGTAMARLLHHTGVPVLHLGVTQAGHPRHPLYIAYGVAPNLWARADMEALTA